MDKQSPKPKANTEPKLPISRYKLANKRRIVIYTKELATLSGLAETQIHALHKKSQLRKGTDWAYNAKKGDFALSLASAQALMVMADTTQSWQAHHAISDFLLKGFRNE